jgi:hypothetical protein
LLRFFIFRLKIKIFSFFFSPRKFRCGSWKTSVHYYAPLVRCRFRLRGEKQDSYHFSSIFPFGTYFPVVSGRRGGQVTRRRELLLFTSLAIRDERTDGRMGRTNVRRQLIHESRLLSYFHRRRKFNVLSSTTARRYTFRTTAAWLRIALFSLTPRVPPDLHSRWPRSFRGRRVRQPKKSLSSPIGSIIGNGVHCERKCNS